MDDIELLLPETDTADPRYLSVARVRLQGTLEQRLPSVPGLSVEKFYMADRSADALAYAQAIGISSDEMRRLGVIMRAKSRAEERLAQRIAEGRGSYVEFM